MDVKSVEILSLQQVADMRRQARQYRKEESERYGRMTMREARSLLWLDFSMLGARAAARGIASEEMQLLFESKGLNKFEETAAIAELLFAQPSQGKGLLVEFSESPSGAFEDRFRQGAKYRKVKIHFYRLTGGWVIITVQSKQVPDESDQKLLKDLGVQW
jgi:hypothetical protein